MPAHHLTPQPLGLGHTWSAALPRLLRGTATMSDAIEVDPRDFWRSAAAGLPTTLDGSALEQLDALPGARILRGSSLPLAGSVDWAPTHAAAWARSVQHLRPAFVSAPLGFAQASEALPDGGTLHAGTVLPPVQCPATVLLAVRRIEQLRRLSAVPVAFHIVPNHLRRQAGEMPDGAFYAAVADAAGCGIVLDLATLQRHERFGRARLREVMASLPLQRVWAVRLTLASLPSSLEWLADWLPSLPQRAALLFDATPVPGSAVSVDAATWSAHLGTLRPLWSQPGKPRSHAGRSGRATGIEAPYAIGPDCTGATWERALACLANHRLPPRGCRLPAGLMADPGLALHRLQIEIDRKAVLVERLPLTCNALAQGLGAAQWQALLGEFWRLHTPTPEALDEVRHFAACLRRGLNNGLLSVPHLRTVLDLELARWLPESANTQVPVDGEPMLALAALSRGQAASTPVAA